MIRSSDRTRLAARTIVWAVALGLAITGCGGEAEDSQAATSGAIDRDADDGWQAGATADWEEVHAAAQDEGQVVVAGFPALAEPMAEAFERDTGIALEWLGGRSGDLSARFAEEARTGNLSMDVILGGTQEIAPMREGLLKPIGPDLLLPGVTDEENWSDGAIKWLDDEGTYIPQPAEYVYGWPVVNTDIINPAEINTWEDLLDEKYKGQIAAYDPTTGGPGQGIAVWLYAALGLDYVRDLFLGQEVTFSTDTQQLAEWASRGTYPIVIGTVQINVERLKAEGVENLEVLLMDEEPGFSTGGYSLPKQAEGAPNPNAATVFLNWYMSQPGQQVYESVMLEPSRRTDVDTKLPQYLVPEEGVSYWDAYTEDAYDERPEVVGLVLDALGGR